MTGTLTLSAAVTESYDLLGTSANITGSAITGLTVDDSNFASNLPFSLAPGGTYTNSINVIAGSNASLGVYSLSYQVEGQGTTTATSASGVGTAQLTVNAANVSAPEPSSLALLIPMMGTIGIIFRRNRVGAS
ncbi:MAG: PEP-CTERM sorting domain-containing protein [Armatimonadota bacterium]